MKMRNEVREEIHESFHRGRGMGMERRGNEWRKSFTRREEMTD